jgi:UDP-GlcNAc:undecaprenyl-phosphate/decaprenyl-phosphate GlcNAc-1-phosphate transferase
MKDIFLLLFSSIFLSSFLIYVFSKVFYKFKLLDNPKKYGIKRNPIPYSMGIVFFINFFLLSYFFIDIDYKLIIMFVFGFVITILSFLDDFFDINPKIRLFFQIAIGFVIALSSIKIGYVSNIFWGIIDLQTYYFDLFSYRVFYIPIFFSIFWYVLIFNALNWSDGVPWLASGLSFISFFIIFLLGLKLFYIDDYEWGIKNAYFIMQISVILLASLWVFWFFDSREKILMWDSGTMFLGFMLATIAIISWGKIATVWVVFWIYLIDAFYVILKRLLNKKNPLKKDFSHMHHRLEKVGLERKQILILLYSLSTFFWLSSLFLDKRGKIFVFILLIFVVVFINIIIDKIKIRKK